MRVALVHNSKFPVVGYGGTERVVWWLAKGLSELGVRVTLVARTGSVCPFAEKVVQGPDAYELVDCVEADVFHFFHTPRRAPDAPYVVTIGGNAQEGEQFDPNTVFVSENHAARHGSTSFVYNGVDPAEYLYSDKKDPYLVFLAKAGWKVKNVRGAIRIARKAGRVLEILGGDRLFLKRFRGIHWNGSVNGAAKAMTLSRASALLFPVLWHEPFGLAVVESFMSGTPVLATPFGSLPELVPAQVGFTCRTEDEFAMALSEIGSIRPRDCRDWAMEKFHYSKMSESYLDKYEQAMSGTSLNALAPRHTSASLTEFHV